MEPSKFGWALILLSAGLPTVAMRWRSLLAPEEKRANPAFMTAVLMIGHLLNTTIRDQRVKRYLDGLSTKNTMSILAML